MWLNILYVTLKPTYINIHLDLDTFSFTDLVVSNHLNMENVHQLFGSYPDYHWLVAMTIYESYSYL